MKVQFNREPLIILHGPSLSFKNFFLNVIAIQKKRGLSVVSEFVVGIWDGLDECQISFCPSPALFYMVVVQS